jgi:Subtilase family
MAIFQSSRLFAAAVLGLCLMALLAGPAAGAGSSPQDPISFDLSAGSIALSLSRGSATWVRVTFTPNSGVSHISFETQGSLDTKLEVFANLAEALRNQPLAEDDDSGPGLNATLGVPLGFPSPYFIRVTTLDSGSSRLRGDLIFVQSDRCDWPAGCPLALAAEGEPEEGGFLKTLREVRSELLLRSQIGRELADLYWRLAKDLIPSLLADSSFRGRLYEDVDALLPLARDAVEVARGKSIPSIFTRVHFDRLRNLRDLISSRVSPDLSAELQAKWQEFALEERVGTPLADTLAATGLVAIEERPRTILVKLRFEPEPDAIRRLTGDARLDARLIAAGVRAVHPVHAATPARRAAGLTRTIAMEVDGEEAARALMTELKSDPSVEWVQLSATLRALAPAGSDPFRGDLWGLDAVRAPQAWSFTAGNCATPVAVVDTGLRSGLADLEGRVLKNLGYDFADDDPDPEDGHGHGTHVAGTIAAAVNNSISVAGVAPGICVFGVKVLSDEGEGTSEDVAEGIVHAADAGARVINLSLGCDCDTQQVIEDALRYAAQRDVVIVAAAGNDGKEGLNYPGSSPFTIAVGALNPDLTLASFSNYGSGLDLAAPGVDVVSLFRDGESCMGSGTSMATPHVSGVAALVRSLNPGLDREKVRALLRQEARDLGAPGYDTKFGAGLVDALDAVNAARGPGGAKCTPTTTSLCLSSDRFRVETFWRRSDGLSGQGQAVRLTPDTGYFWFFNSSNVESFVKVLDACGLGGRFWVFGGGLTNVEVRTRVTDTATGQIKEYTNPLGTAFQPIQDTNAFATCSAVAAATASTDTVSTPEQALSNLLQLITEVRGQEPGTALATCTSNATAMCLGGGRFRVEADWRKPDGQSGTARVVRLTDDTGYFWFFNESNAEVFVKVLNACVPGINRFWVFSGGLTNVEVRLRVTDTKTGQVKSYTNPLGIAFRPIQDTNAFATCP